LFRAGGRQIALSIFAPERRTTSAQRGVSARAKAMSASGAEIIGSKTSAA
jgi:hypothetical protein